MLHGTALSAEVQIHLCCSDFASSVEFILAMVHRQLCSETETKFALTLNMLVLISVKKKKKAGMQLEEKYPVPFLKVLGVYLQSSHYIL